MLTPDQLHTLLGIIEKQSLLFVGATLGEESLTDQEKQTLKDFGIDYKTLYREERDLVSLNFKLGMLSSILSDKAAKSLTYDQLERYIKSGQHIPLNARERATVHSIKMQSLQDIRAVRGKIFQDINNVVTNLHGSNRANQEEYLRGQIERGVASRESRKTIARAIAKLTGDWPRNFNKSVAYISHTALNEGRAAVLERRYEGTGKEPKMYFQVQDDACDYCIKAFLTNGKGSEPKVFTLKELQANGSNIGRKAADWQPVLHSFHIHCRCLATEYIEGMVWDGTKFVYPKQKPDQNRSNRPKFRVSINGEEHWV